MNRPFLLLFLLLPMTVAAAEDEAQDACRDIEDPIRRLECYDDAGDPKKVKQHEYDPYYSGLRSDGPNFFGISGASGSNPLGEINHLEFNISIRYPLIDCAQMSRRGDHCWPIAPDRVYAIYNGSYDFHAFSKPEWYSSAPIISTHQNPGIAMEWDGADPTRKYRLGVFHHSNGQSVGPKDVGLINGYIHNPEIEYAWWLQEVSRSSNYISLRYQNMSNEHELIRPGWQQVQLEWRPHYFVKDDSIFWGSPPIAPGEQPDIEDYDGLRLMWEKVTHRKWQTFALVQRVELKTGTRDLRALSNGSVKYSFGFMARSFIMTAYMSSEYGHDLSTYHLRTHQWGIGLELR